MIRSYSAFNSETPQVCSHPVVEMAQMNRRGVDGQGTLIFSVWIIFRLKMSRKFVSETLIGRCESSRSYMLNKRPVTLIHMQTDLSLTSTRFTSETHHLYQQSDKNELFWIEHVKSIRTSGPRVSQIPSLILCCRRLSHLVSFSSALYLPHASAEETPYRSGAYQALINATRKHTD